MTNFAFLPFEFRTVAEPAMKSEEHIYGDPRAACFHARFALEAMVHWLYRHDNTLRMPYDRKLAALLYEPTFQNLLPEAVFQKARVIHQVGNQAVHNPRPVKQYDALRVVKELHHLCYWLTRTYTPTASRDGAAWKDDRVPPKPSTQEVVPRDHLEALEKQLADQNAQQLKDQQQRDELDAELRVLRAELAEMRAAAEQQPDTHDYSEADTRTHLIDIELHRAGWPLDQKRDREYPVVGMPNQKGEGYVDYVLWGDDSIPLAVVEAKKTTVDATVGQQQAKLYADCLETMKGRRPLIFYTNGYTTWFWDDTDYPPRQVAGFFKKDELERLIHRRTQRNELDTANVKDAIASRYYQKRAIGSICEHFTQKRRKALLVMATGTGKTRTAIALVDLLQRAGWIKRALFLADRIALVNQAVGAFKAHLPESSPVNLVTDKNATGRVYVSTYPTMMGLIDENKGGTASFSPGHFDLVIIDEAHRSVYQRYGAIFRYFDSFLVGLTATPREEVDRNTYGLFELEPGVPTDAYELVEAVRDGFLVPPRAEQIDLKFPREGIDYDSLSDEEKEQWESLDWGDDVDPENLPDRVSAAAINSWLFNKDTVDKVLKHVMEHGHKVEGGDRLAKTIMFARNHEHAKFIEERFNQHYPVYAGQFARVIDNYVKYAQSLIDAFTQKDKDPHIAISVDMLDTGIDVPEVANLVFFKPVYSKIKFWQMIGRGTRLYPELYGPDDDKKDFRVFDFCFNFDFFNENPKGIEGQSSPPLSTRLFRYRLQLLATVSSDGELDPDKQLGHALTDELHGEVAAMNRENFIVRMQAEAVDRFKDRAAWNDLNEVDLTQLHDDVAGLPSEAARDKIESRMFDLMALRLQLAFVHGDAASFETHRVRVVEIAMLLEEKTAIPAVAKQLEYLARIQESTFWEGMDLKQLEDLRLRLRVLVPFLDKNKRKVVYTDFQDQITGIRQGEPIDIPKMTGEQYEKKVKEYLSSHKDDLVIQRLRSNQPLTKTNLEELEATLARIGEDDGTELLTGLLRRTGSPSLAHFVKRMVGMDRAAAHAAFAGFLSDRSLTPKQIRFIEMVIEQLTTRGVMEESALYETPFTRLHDSGPDGLFAGRENVIKGVFEKLKAINSESESMVG